VDTQSIALKLSKFIDEKLEVDVPINIKISGCPNSCGHTNTADIGIRGSIIKQEGKRYEAFDVFLGGKLGQGATFGQKLDLRLRENELIKAIANI
jgi:ferredoxin-nitrite reductase